MSTKKWNILSILILFVLIAAAIGYMVLLILNPEEYYDDTLAIVVLSTFSAVMFFGIIWQFLSLSSNLVIFAYDAENYEKAIIRGVRHLKWNPLNRNIVKIILAEICLSIGEVEKFEKVLDSVNKDKLSTKSTKRNFLAKISYRFNYYYLMTFKHLLKDDTYVAESFYRECIMLSQQGGEENFREIMMMLNSIFCFLRTGSESAKAEIKALILEGADETNPEASTPIRDYFIRLIGYVPNQKEEQTND